MISIFLVPFVLTASAQYHAAGSNYDYSQYQPQAVEHYGPYAPSQQAVHYDPYAPPQEAAKYDPYAPPQQAVQYDPYAPPQQAVQYDPYAPQQAVQHDPYAPPQEPAKYVPPQEPAKYTPPQEPASYKPKEPAPYVPVEHGKEEWDQFWSNAELCKAEFGLQKCLLDCSTETDFYQDRRVSACLVQFVNGFCHKLQIGAVGDCYNGHTSITKDSCATTAFADAILQLDRTAQEVDSSIFTAATGPGNMNSWSLTQVQLALSALRKATDCVSDAFFYYLTQCSKKSYLSKEDVQCLDNYLADGKCLADFTETAPTFELADLHAHLADDGTPDEFLMKWIKKHYPHKPLSQVLAELIAAQATRIDTDIRTMEVGFDFKKHIASVDVCPTNYLSMNQGLIPNSVIEFEGIPADCVAFHFPRDKTHRTVTGHPTDEVCLFTDINFKGDKSCVAADNSVNFCENGCNSFNDKIKSILVPKGLKVSVFQHDFKGTEWEITSSVPDLAGQPPANQITSAMVTEVVTPEEITKLDPSTPKYGIGKTCKKHYQLSKLLYLLTDWDMGDMCYTINGYSIKFLESGNEEKLECEWIDQYIDFVDINPVTTDAAALLVNPLPADNDDADDTQLLHVIPDPQYATCYTASWRAQKSCTSHLSEWQMSVECCKGYATTLAEAKPVYHHYKAPAPSKQEFSYNQYHYGAALLKEGEYYDVKQYTENIPAKLQYTKVVSSNVNNGTLVDVTVSPTPIGIQSALSTKFTDFYTKLDTKINEAETQITAAETDTTGAALTALYEKLKLKKATGQLNLFNTPVELPKVHYYIGVDHFAKATCESLHIDLDFEAVVPLASDTCYPQSCILSQYAHCVEHPPEEYKEFKPYYGHYGQVQGSSGYGYHAPQASSSGYGPAEAASGYGYHTPQASSSGYGPAEATPYRSLISEKSSFHLDGLFVLGAAGFVAGIVVIAVFQLVNKPRDNMELI